MFRIDRRKIELLFIAIFICFVTYVMTTAWFSKGCRNSNKNAEIRLELCVKAYQLGDFTFTSHQKASNLFQTAMALSDLGHTKEAHFYFLRSLRKLHLPLKSDIERVKQRLVDLSGGLEFSDASTEILKEVLVQLYAPERPA
ncbi:MAG: hypothetical protein AB8B79_22220 [Granulosicoccus sp.]